MQHQMRVERKDRNVIQEYQEVYRHDGIFRAALRVEREFVNWKHKTCSQCWLSRKRYQHWRERVMAVTESR